MSLIKSTLYGCIFLCATQVLAERRVEIQSDTSALPSIPISVVRMLWDSSTLVDYVFFDLPISVSLTEKASIQQSIRHIGSLPAPEGGPCKPVGKLFYQVEGNIRLEADLYYSEGCQYYVYYQDGKKVWSNTMSSEGIEFFKKIMSRH